MPSISRFSCAALASAVLLSVPFADAYATAQPQSPAATTTTAPPATTPAAPAATAPAAPAAPKGPTVEENVLLKAFPDGLANRA